MERPRESGGGGDAKEGFLRWARAIKTRVELSEERQADVSSRVLLNQDIEGI